MWAPKRRMGLSTSLIKLLLGLFNLIFCVRPLRTREPAFQPPLRSRDGLALMRVGLVGSW